MPIYEYACPNCRKIFSFLSKRLHPARQPKCPQCGRPRLTKKLSPFAMISGTKTEAPAAETLDERRMMRAMGELERDMGHLDENNPKHVARLMRKMQQFLPAKALPREMETAVKRLEAGEDPEKIETDMGELFGEAIPAAAEGSPGSGNGFAHDPGLYDL